MARGCGVVGWFSLQCVIVVIPDHAHLLFYHAFTLPPLNDVSSRVFLNDINKDDKK